MLQSSGFVYFDSGARFYENLGAGDFFRINTPAGDDYTKLDTDGQRKIWLECEASNNQAVIK